MSSVACSSAIFAGIPHMLRCQISSHLLVGVSFFSLLADSGLWSLAFMAGIPSVSWNWAKSSSQACFGAFIAATVLSYTVGSCRVVFYSSAWSNLSWAVR